MTSKEGDLPTSPAQPATRRCFLRVIVLGATGSIAACGGGGAEPEAFGRVAAGNVADLPEGTLRAIAGAPAYVGRDAEGVYAMTSTCTHEGCDMISGGRITDQGVQCDCHGATFDRLGSVVRGPAEDDLTHFAVELDAAGNITVLGDARVSAAVRTPVA